MFGKKQSVFAAKALGLSEDHEIIVASIKAQYVCEDDLCKAVFGDDYDDEEDIEATVSSWDLQGALRDTEKSVDLPKNHMLVGLGLPCSRDNLTFGIVDFSGFKTQ
ncbi:MAG: hypothetical protein ACRBBW_03960 [Cellvibrionaceae bacterium]